MTSPVVSAAVFALLIASSACGIALRVRRPRLLAAAGTREVIGRTLSLVSVLAALVLGMSIVELKSTFDGADRDSRRLGSEIEDLNRTLRRIGPPAAEVRQLLFRYATVLVRDTFVELAVPFRGQPDSAGDLQDQLEASLDRLANSASRSAVVSEAQEVLHAIVQTRWSLAATIGTSLSFWQLGILGFWMMLLFAGFGLVTPRTMPAITALLFSALALASAVFLLTEFADPFTGIIVVSGEPLLNALHALAEQ